MSSTPITVLVHRYAGGDRSALDELVPQVYAELRRIAQSHVAGEKAGHSLPATALVHEMYARLAANHPPEIQDRAHFLSLAAHVMRQILIDHARAKFAQKRGGNQEKLTVDDDLQLSMERPAIAIRVDDALNELARHDPRKAQLIEMRFFGGLTAEESALVLNLPVQKVRSELRVALAWLQRELNPEANSAGASAADRK